MNDRKCPECGGPFNRRTPTCTACNLRHFKWLRTKDPRGLLNTEEDRCGRCGAPLTARTATCTACKTRHGRWSRKGDSRAITIRRYRCIGCGCAYNSVTAGCEHCAHRAAERDRRKQEARGDQDILFQRTLDASPIDPSRLRRARDIQNHQALTVWLNRRTQRLNPTKKEKKMTTHTTLTGETLTTEQLQALALELVNIQADIAELKEEAAKIEATLKSLPTGKYTAGDASLTVSHPKRFNEKKFAAAYPPESFPQFYQTVAKVNLKALAPALKEEYADSTTARLTIR